MQSTIHIFHVFIIAIRRVKRYLRRRHLFKSLRNLLLPPKPRLAINLRRRLEPCTKTAVVEKHSAQNDIIVHDVLLVIYVCGAVLAVVLIPSLAQHSLDNMLWDVDDLRSAHHCPNHPYKYTYQGRFPL